MEHPVNNVPLTYATAPGGPQLADSEVRKILDAVVDHTMVHTSGIEFLIHETIRTIRADIPGAFVECGTWRGGASVAILLAQRAAFGTVQRPIWMLDSFEGLPAVDNRDGPLAADWQAGGQPEKFMDNCRAAQGELIELLARHGFSDDEAHIVPGWFADTVPDVVEKLEQRRIALLRLDSDWYESTKYCLDQLMPLVADEAVVIIDDYYAWDGCARAVHEYIVQNDVPYRLKSLYNNYGMYFVKRAARRSYEVF